MRKIGLTLFITLGVTLITTGVNFVTGNRVLEGVLAIVAGMGVVHLGVYLYEKGLIELVKGVRG